MLNSFLLGAAYGIGGTAFGISIRYIGFSLTYAIAVGLSSVLGTLIPPLVKGTLGTTLEKPGVGLDYCRHRDRRRSASRWRARRAGSRNTISQRRRARASFP